MQTFGFDAILKAVDMALDRRKILLAFRGVITIVLVSGVLAYLAVSVRGVFINAFLLFLSGVAAWLLGAVFSGALTYMSWKDLQGEDPVDQAEAISYGIGHLVAFALSPLALIITAALILLAEMLLLQLGRIPALGPVLIALIFIPLVLVNILIVIGTTAGSWLVFPIIAATGSGVIDTVRHVTTLVRESPARLIVYFIFAGLVVLIVILIAWPLVAAGVTQTVGLIALSTAGAALDGFGSGGMLDMALDLVNPSGSFRLAAFLFSLQVALLVAAAGLVVPWVFSLSAGSAVYATLAGTPVAETTRPSSIFGREQPAGRPAPAGPSQTSFSGATLSAPTEQTRITPPYQPPVAGTPTQGPMTPPAEATPPAQTVPCISCQRDLEAGARFCPFCGTQQR